MVINILIGQFIYRMELTCSQEVKFNGICNYMQTCSFHKQSPIQAKNKIKYYSQYFFTVKAINFD